MAPREYKIPALSTHYAGLKFRSRVEARWAVFFDALNIHYEYEFEGFQVLGEGYLPDFWLPQLRIYLEVKPTGATPEEQAKCEAVALGVGVDMLIAVGSPSERFQLTWFGPAGKHDDAYVFAVDRISEFGLWLVGETGCTWIGPGPLDCQTRGPMFSGALEEAIDLAKSYDFPREKTRRPVAPIPWTEDRTLAYFAAA